MTDRIRSASDKPAALLTVLARSGGRLPVGFYVDRHGCRRRIAYQTAAALVRRGRAEWFLGPDGDRWIVLTDAGRAATDHIRERG